MNPLYFSHSYETIQKSGIISNKCMRFTDKVKSHIVSAELKQHCLFLSFIVPFA